MPLLILFLVIFLVSSLMRNGPLHQLLLQLVGPLGVLPDLVHTSSMVLLALIVTFRLRRLRRLIRG